MAPWTPITTCNGLTNNHRGRPVKEQSWICQKSFKWQKPCFLWERQPIFFKRDDRKAGQSSVGKTRSNLQIKEHKQESNLLARTSGMIVRWVFCWMRRPSTPYSQTPHLSDLSGVFRKRGHGPKQVTRQCLLMSIERHGEWKFSLQSDCLNHRNYPKFLIISLLRSNPMNGRYFETNFTKHLLHTSRFIVSFLC